MKKIAAYFLFLNLVSSVAVAGYTPQLIDEVFDQVPKNTFMCSREQVHQNFLRDAGYVVISDWGLVRFSDTFVRNCGNSEPNRRHIRNVILLNIAKKYRPEIHWSLDVLLQGWNGSHGFNDTDLKLQDIYPNSGP